MQNLWNVVHAGRQHKQIQDALLFALVLPQDVLKLLSKQPSPPELESITRNMEVKTC